MIGSQWLVLLERFNNIKLHHYVIMPNHFHAIIEIVGVPLVGTHSNVKKTLGDMMGAFKSITTNQYIKGVKNSAWKQFNKRLWQRNYWEHIIRNENEYTHLSQYIIDNPQKWEMDKLNPNESIEIKKMSYLNA